MRCKYLFILIVFTVNSLKAQTTGALSLKDEQNDNLLALNTSAPSDYSDLATGYSLPAARGRSAGAGEGVRYGSFYESLDLGIVSPASKYAGLSAKGNGLLAQVEVGAKIPVLFTQYSQYVVTGSLFYESFSAKSVFADTFGKKRNFNVSCVGIPLTLTVIGLNRSGAKLGYYYELGVNVGYAYSVKDGDNDFTKQFNSIMVQPTAGLGMCIALDGGERLNNRTMLLGLFVTDEATNMAKTSGVTMNGFMYGIRYTGIIN